MAAKPCRKFNLGDGMILIAASAVGFTLFRAFARGTTPTTAWAHYLMICGTPVMVAGSLACLMIRIRNPRPSRARICRQPGMIASLGAALMLVIWMALDGSAALIAPKRQFMDEGAFSGISVGPVILGAWIALGAARALRFERGWIDRMGRVVGVGWLLLMLITLLSVFANL